MNVDILECRQNHPAFQVNDPRGRRDMRIHVLISSDAKYVAGLNGYGLCPTARAIHGVDGARLQHEIVPHIRRCKAGVAHS
jgi:hypothetical protein